jgi:hypothetical protein
MHACFANQSRRPLPQLILLKAQPKRLGGFVLTGPVLAGLTEAYVAAINDGAVPTIATAWQARGGGAKALAVLQPAAVPSRQQTESACACAVNAPPLLRRLGLGCGSCRLVHGERRPRLAAPNWCKG